MCRGVGKTTLGHALARALDCRFIGFSSPATCCRPTCLAFPCSIPSRNEFEFKPGPIFANIVLADEINRTTPKTQSALLEANERKSGHD
jgi:MoxR-like ATPase